MPDSKNLTTKALLIAEDDDDDYLLTRKALQDNHYAGELFRVKDGLELLDFLTQRLAEMEGEAVRGSLHFLILLDLNMPRKDGRQTLSEIRANPGLRSLPIVVLTTSSAAVDIEMAYDLGANSYVRKPSSYSQFSDLIKIIVEYWFDAVEWPSGRETARRWQVL